MVVVDDAYCDVFTSRFVTQGVTHIMMMGNMMIILGMNLFRIICLNSFSNRYFIVISCVFLFQMFFKSLQCYAKQHYRHHEQDTCLLGNRRRICPHYH